ncbi:hypothetical protein [Nannocystis pusilla]|uniref:hypothetical protein n=1 Tax=Nannocystis pusilla TaxID=889268 RepID=UPI003B7E2506
MPWEAGNNLRALIRPPGMPLPRARALIAFLLEGLAAAHARGLVHGSLLPAQLVCDAAGRPLLGPFGADAIAGLIATRTGALEELLTITAPEVRAGGPHGGQRHLRRRRPAGRARRRQPRRQRARGPRSGRGRARPRPRAPPRRDRLARAHAPARG